MAQISVTSGAQATTPVETNPVALPSGARALNRAASEAVQQLNDANYAGAGREVTFSVDRASHTPVIKIVDTITRETIQQFPLEYFLQFAAESQNSR